MLDDELVETTTTETPAAEVSAPRVTKRVRKTAVKKPDSGRAKKAASAEPAPELPLAVAATDEAHDAAHDETQPATKPAAKKAAKATAKRTAAKTTKATAKKSTAKKTAATPEAAEGAADTSEAPAAADVPPAKKAAKRTSRAKAKAGPAPVEEVAPEQAPAEAAPAEAAPAIAVPLFQAPDTTKAPARRTRKKAAPAVVDEVEVSPTEAEPAVEAEPEPGEADADEESGTGRRKRRRGGRRRRKSGDGEATDAETSEDVAQSETTETTETTEAADEGATETGEDGAGEGGSRRRRRRRRSGDGGGDASDDPQNTVTRVRRQRNPEDEITAVSGSTRLEAKKQRRREGREAGRRRAPIVSEAEFLARRESVERVMVIRQKDDISQIAVLEDKVLVEHYVARESQTSLIGNVYLGRVQNVLPSMEAAFIDIGRGRNAVLYAGEVNWSALGHPEGQPRKIESVLSSGRQVLVQVTKDPIGHKGARLTSQISLAGRFLVYVPDGTTSGISRKLPDNERTRLKTLLKEIVPDTAGVIVRTAAEGASEEELTRDVERLKARWEEIDKQAKGGAPKMLYGEPDLTLKVVRDLFTEDFAKLVVQGDDAWETVHGYVTAVAPDLESRLERYEPEDGRDLFAAYRIDEQIHKGLDRKVWLPSGGSLIIDRTEAMTVVDVNTGKFTGSGGNLEETVTKNNLEAAEEMVRQLRLRDIGGIIVVDFIDMVLESNRDLVLRRLVECLGRDRTRHQVAEVTSLGLVQMTRKRIGTGLLESFSHDCEACKGRGVVVEDAPVEPQEAAEEGKRGKRSRGGRSGGGNGGNGGSAGSGGRQAAPSPSYVATVAKPHPELDPVDGEEAPGGGAEAAETGPILDSALEPVPESATIEPVSESVAVPEIEPEIEPEVRSEPETGPELTPDPGPESGPEPEVVAVAAPKVVTRTRRRAASRPAGPPSGAEESAAGVPEVAPEVAVEMPTDEPPALHVPVKKRGSRKR